MYGELDVMGLKVVWSKCEAAGVKFSKMASGKSAAGERK